MTDRPTEVTAPTEAAPPAEPHVDASADPPPRRHGLPIWTAIVVALVLLATAAGIGVWGWSLDDDAARIRSVAAERDVSISQARTQSTDVEAQTSAADTKVIDEQAALKAAEDDIKRLEFASTVKSTCIADQKAVLGDLNALFDKEKKNFDRSVTGSKFAKADAAGWKAMEAAVNDSENAYKAIAAGNVSGANTWISRRNAQVAVQNKQVRIADAEIKAINKSTKETNAAGDALDSKVQQTISFCGA